MTGYAHSGGSSAKDDRGDFTYVVCSKCSNRWKIQDGSKPPRNCPSCRSTVWMKPSERRVCVRCGHSWNASGRVPGRCAKCGTYKWNEAPTRFDCSKCGHEWTAQGKKPPNKCPKCRSTLWNDASGNAGNGDSREAYDSDTRNIYLDMVERPRLEEILLKYRRGSSCTSIAISTGVSFSIVYGIINDEYPMSSIRV